MTDFPAGVFPELTVTAPVVRTNPTGSVVDRMRLLVNAIATTLINGMPGVLTSAPATKTGTTSAKTWRSEAFTFACRGLQQSKAAAETGFTDATHDIALSKQAWFVLSIASGGTLTITKAADQTIGTDLLPQCPDNQIVVGWAKIVTGSGGIWDAVTDDFAVGGNVVSLTIVDGPVISTILPVE